MHHLFRLGGVAFRSSCLRSPVLPDKYGMAQRLSLGHTLTVPGAGDILASKVCHASAPVYRPKLCEEARYTYDRLLRNCYRSALGTSHNVGARRVITPFLSTSPYHSDANAASLMHFSMELIIANCLSSTLELYVVLLADREIEWCRDHWDVAVHQVIDPNYGLTAFSTMRPGVVAAQGQSSEPPSATTKILPPIDAQPLDPFGPVVVALRFAPNII